MVKKDSGVILLNCLLLSILFFTIIFWQYGCTNRGSEPANIILISIDTLRADHLGIYGHTRDTSPAIDRLAKNGIFFKQAYTTAPWTLPAHMSLLSGLPPSLHGVEMDNQKLGREIKTLPQVFIANNYQTAGFVTLPFTMAKYGFSRGFKVFKECLKEPADVVTDQALAWLGQTRQKKFFLFLHYCDVHWPYSPPKKYARLFHLNPQGKRWDSPGRYIYLKKFVNPGKKMPEKIRSIVLKLYDGEIRSVDQQIKRLYSFLLEHQLAENTVIVITSDHGEEFNEHQSFGHGHSFYAELTKIPLIIHNPARIKPGSIIDEPVSLLDIPNTLLRLAGIKPESQFTDHAVDLSRYFTAKKTILHPRRQIIMETTWAGPKRLAIIQNQHKYFDKSWFQTPGKNREWVSIPAGMFDVAKDAGDSLNLLNRTVQDAIVAKQKTGYQQNLNQYTTDHAQGLRLIFKNSDLNLQSPVKVQAELTFDQPLMGHPFSINTAESDQVTMDKDKKSVRINIQLIGKRKIIFFPTSRGHQKVGLKLQQDGITIFHQFPKIPPSGQPVELLVDKSRGIHITIQGSIRNPSYHQKKLSDQEIKTLKSLGYINERP